MTSLVERMERRNLESNLKELRREKKIEADQVNNSHQKAISNQKSYHQKELSSIKSEQEAIRSHELKTRSKQLTEIKKSVEDVKKTTQQELEQIKNHHQNKKSNMTHRYKDEISSLQDRYAESVEENKEDNNYKLKQIKQDHVDQTKKAETNRFEQSLKLSNKKDRYVAEIKNENDKEINKTRHKTKMNLKSEINQHHLTVTDQREKFRKDLSVLGEVHQKGLMDQELKQNKEMKNKQKSFETKYTAKLEGHQKLSQTLADKKSEMITKLKTEVLEDHQKNIDLYKDEFYHYKKIDHTLTKNKDGYLLEIPISEKNRPFLSVRPNGKKIGISFNRSFKEKRTEDGATNKVSRVEAFHKNIPLDRPINSRKVESYFQEGKLKFKIPFA